MSIQHIIESLEKLTRIYEDLLGISQQKTEIVKSGSIEKFQKLLVNERKIIRFAEQAETKRMQDTEKWFIDNNLPLDDVSVTYVLRNIDNETEKNKLEQITVKLAEAIMNIRQQEQLNQSLINQSIKFVQLSLDMVNPSIQNMNYGKNNDHSTSAKRSIFDSKA